MALANRNANTFKKLSMPMSYQLLAENRLYEARNVFDNKGVTETRPGIRRYNSTGLVSQGFTLDLSYLDYDYLQDDEQQPVLRKVLSGSFFKNSSNERYKIVKIGPAVYSAKPSGNHDILKTGLSDGTKHRGITLNDRHILAIEGDGLYQFNGSTLTQLGQLPPTTGSVAAAAGGSLADKTWQVGLTFYSSVTGFETNVFASAQQATATTNNTIAVSNIPATADNATIDKVRIYLKNVTDNTAFLFYSEINLGTTTANITDEPTSALTPPTTSATPVTGGGKYLAAFGSRLAYSGNAIFPNDVFFSEEYIPDAFDDTTTARTITIDGQGPITGIAVGLYDNSYLSPFLVAFKKTSVTIYSELGGSISQVMIDGQVGCISHDTIRVRNGVVYFMSENGWYRIRNGSLERDRGIPVSLGSGDIDDIFSRNGWTYQLNADQYENFFSAYYSTLGHYLTFIAENGNNSFYKAYNYEERIDGFRVYQFKTPLSCAFEGEDDNGNQCVFLGDLEGFLYTYSVKNDRRDEDKNATSQSIPAFVYLPFTIPGDESISYNWRSLILKAIAGNNDLMVRAFTSYGMLDSETLEFDFSNADSGFVLDLSQLDVDVLGDERTPKSFAADICRSGEVLILGFFQDAIDSNMGLISSQLFYNRNGNRNT